MISARDFAVTNSSFWKLHFPALESFVRDVNNGAYTRFMTPMKWDALPEKSSLLSEAAFCEAMRKFSREEDIAESIQYANARLIGLRGYEDISELINDKDKKLVTELSQRLYLMIIDKAESSSDVTFDPSFSGNGVISNSIGDVISGSELFEIKSVERSFRSTDFRQLLTYVFLNSFEPLHKISSICLANPRKGTLFRSEVAQFIYDVSGLDFIDAQTVFLSACSAGGISK